MSSSFGRQVLATTTTDEFVELEKNTGQASRFTELDALVGGALARGLRGEKVVDVVRDNRRDDTCAIVHLDSQGEDVLDAAFSLERQQERGAWFLPEEARIKSGKINFIHLYRQSPFAGSLIDGDSGSVPLAHSPAALLAWSVLEPFFETLIIPLDLRTRLLGEKDEEAQSKLWAQFDDLAVGMDLELAHVLDVYRYGGGWPRLDTAGQTTAREALFAAFAEHADAATIGRNYRLSRLRGLINRFYSKAKSGTPTRRQVLIKAEERTLSGFFGGDWLAFLDYLQEQPAAGEEVITILPRTRLLTASSDRIATLAADKNMPVEEVERVMAAAWGQQTAVSPAEKRLEVLNEFWQVFDQLHQSQAPGQRPLWGLVEQHDFLNYGDERDDGRLNPDAFEQLVPDSMRAEVEQLWGCVMLPRWPERMVTCFRPPAQMGAAFGPALTFWQGCALTAWFLCEGPYSRTDMAGLANYHVRELDALNALGCPIDRNLFDELVEAERKLPKPEPVYDDADDDSNIEVAPGLRLTVRISTGGEKRKGFEILRDIITRHRRAWAAAHLASYLTGRWQGEVRAAGHELNRLIAEKGKPPTAKQFAKSAADATNHWFGGDLSVLYAMIGERAPVKPEYHRLIPDDPAGFAKAMFTALGGKPFEIERVVADRAQAKAQQVERENYSLLRTLAQESLSVVQLEEALGAPPELAQFGRSKFAHIGERLWGDVETGWEKYLSTIRTVRQEVSIASPEVVQGGPDQPHVSLLATHVDRGPAVQKLSEPEKSQPHSSLLGRLLGRD